MWFIAEAAAVWGVGLTVAGSLLSALGSAASRGRLRPVAGAS